MSAFLDSRHGRNFADDVTNALLRPLPPADAIAIATGRWVVWTIGRRTACETGIPHGLPYLTGFVVHAAIAVNAAA